MAAFPLAQRKAQEELAAVIGLSRLPTINDRASLPYVQALLLEVLRWWPVVPLGLAHRSIEDDEYNGYFIPAHTTVFVNEWYVARFRPSPSRCASSQAMRSTGPSCTTLSSFLTQRNLFPRDI